jgi:hypothetical protein
VLVLVSRVSHLVVIAAFAGVAAYGQLVPVGSAERVVYGGGWTSPAAVVPSGATVGVDPQLHDPIGRYAYPWQLPGRVRLAGDSDYLFMDAPGGTAPSPRVVWTDPRGRVALVQVRP